MAEIKLNAIVPFALQNLFTLAMLAGFLAPLSHADNFCPIILVSGVNDQGSLTVSFRNAGKLPIQQIELNCTRLREQGQRSRGSVCHVETGLFFPGTEYEMKYTYPGGIPRVVLVSLRSVTLSDGYVWKPARGQTCQPLKIRRGKR